MNIANATKAWTGHFIYATYSAARRQRLPCSTRSSYGLPPGGLFREQRVKSGYAEMIIRRQRIREAKPFHHHKTQAIRERELLIQMFQHELAGGTDWSSGAEARPV